MKLIHYTTLLNAFHILKSKSITMGSLRYSNDKMEKIAIEDECRTIFIFCCSMGKLNASMWLSYSGRKGGAAIIFEFESEQDAKNMLLNNNYEIESKKIDYVEDYFDDWKDVYAGRAKHKLFEFEDEYRYLIDMDSYFDYQITCQLNLKVIKKITLVVSEEDYIIAKEFLKNIGFEISVEKNNFIQ